MRFIKILFIFALISFSSPLKAGIYLEKPADFNPKAEIVGCCFLYYKDKILILHRQDAKAEGNRWGIPGGKLNKGEPIVEAILREVFEETGFHLDKEKIHYIGKVYIKVPNFDFEYHMIEYQQQIERPGDVKINFKEHK